LVANSRVEAIGIEISEQTWLGDVLSLTFTGVPQRVFWQVFVTPLSAEN